jgi:hypothetical protein
MGKSMSNSTRRVCLGALIVLTPYDKDKETITLKGLTGTVAVTAQY